MMSMWTDQVLAVARTEWRVTWRGLGVRLVLVMLALPFIPYLLLPRTNVDDGGLQILTFIAPFAGLLAAFLIVPGPRREKQFRTAELTWVRPLDGLTYVAGKVLTATLVMALLLAELVALVALTQATASHGVSPHLVALALLITAPTLLLCAMLYVVVGAVLPHPLLGYVIALAVTFLCAFFLVQSMLVLANPWTVALFYNPILGFGPDLPLLVANRLLYLGLTLTLGGAAVFLFRWRERRALAPRRQGRIALVALLCGLAVGGVGLTRFLPAAAAVTITGPVRTPTALPLPVARYRLDVLLDPATGDVEGTARFTIRNTGSTPLTTLPLLLNDGLHIGAATVGGRPAGVTNSPEFGHVALAPALQPGRSTAVVVRYGGRFKVLHADYGPTSHGVQTSWGSLPPALHPTYLYGGIALLYRDGAWYPVPWTQATTTVQPPPLGWRSLVISLRTTQPVIVSTADVQRHGTTEVARWSSLDGRLPTAVLAVLPPSYRAVATSGGVVYAADGDAATLRARYGPYVQALSDLERFFGRPSRPIAVVAQPLAGAGPRYPLIVALGPGLAIVPVGGVDARIDGTESRLARQADPAPYRAALNDLAVAWWADRLPSQTYALHTDTALFDLPTGYTDLVDRGASGDMAGVLPGYTGAAVAGVRLGVRYYAAEMALRRALDSLQHGDRTLDQLNADHRLNDILYAGQGPLAARVRALGLWMRINAFWADASPALDDLRQAIGPERLRRVLVSIATAGTGTNESMRVACLLSRATGQPVTAWMGRYIPPALASFLPAGRCP